MPADWIPCSDRLPDHCDADTLRSMLRRKFPEDQYAMLYEVRDAAGFEARRVADVIMVGLWPSRGCLIEGMELKVSRADWLRELKRPEKAEAFVPYCDRWWVVSADASIVKLEELPKTWGLMVVTGRRLQVVQDAPRLEAKPIDRTLLAAMMKRATKMVEDSPEIRSKIDARLRALEEDFERRVESRVASLKSELAELRSAIAEFEKQSGVNFSPWQGGKIGAAVKLVLAGEHEWRVRELGRLKEQVRRLHQWFEQEIP